MTSDDLLQLQQPLTEGGIRSVNFFNGRLLTSKDLTREQVARREADARLGLAVGDGVAFGLDVQRGDGTNAVVLVKAGLAINRLGQTLRLTQDTQVALTRQFDAGSIERCLFGPCAQLVGGTYIAGAGVYLLTLTPAVVTEGRAPTNGLDPQNVRCNSDANVEALQFRLLALTPQMLAGLDIGSTRFRNELAYRCFGAGVQPDWFESLLTAEPPGDDLLDALGAISLSAQEVPLALLQIQGGAELAAIDMWAVRRPVCRPASGGLASLVDTRRQAVGHAMFMQFQAQVAELGAPLALPAAVTARSHFRYLPAVGVIPLADEASSTSPEASRFFAGMPSRGPAFINGARVAGLVREGLSHPPIDTQGGEFVWLYRVRENRMAIELGSSVPTARNYLVFASGHLPYRADAQYELARFGYSNYALGSTLS